ncbi:RidA family protein [Variovorax sp. HJSM1_2]|uniref:RidA family protein n=1 Tax=Variovorax sp. HJSM1_2 TaxID=3366263 RepID=UPI003BD4419E
MTASRTERLQQLAQAEGLDISAELRLGGRYTPVVQHAGISYLSGQVPRVGLDVVVQGSAGREVTLADAQRAARIGALRSLIILHQQPGGLEHVQQVLRVSVFVQSAPDFSQQSEVADAASDLLVEVLGPAGVHSRTSVGVAQLPKNATVEVELTVAVEGVKAK